MVAAHQRRLIGVLVAGVVLSATTACVNTAGPPAASSSPSASTSAPTSAPPATATSAAPTSAAPTASSVFPSSARLYAEALLLAWRTKQQTRLAELVTPSVLAQLQATKTLEPNWGYSSCQGAAGSTYCQFVNTDGDAVTLRLANQLLGQAHAISEVKLDLTRYSNNAVEYVKAFIEAWRNGNTKRMSVLANQSEVDYFTHYTPPGTYSTCATLSGGTTSVRVYNADGLNYTLTVAVALLGGKHAITGHTATTPVCT